MFDDQLPPLIAPVAAPEPHRALYLRWRPQTFEDVVGQEHVTRTLRNAVKLGRPSHAYLFTGPRGTGKTSAARILFRAVNCQNGNAGDPCNACPLCVAALDNRALDLVEIDAASSGGIDDIRDLREKIAYRPNEAQYRVYIVDEAHELSKQAWDAFLKTLEEPPPHAIFILATTEAHKVPATIVSRCQRFDFRRIPYQATRDHLARVAESEGVSIEPAVLQRLAMVARGGLRDALSLLDQLSAFAGGQVDMTVARAALSLPSIEAVQGVIDGMSRRDPRTVMALLSDAAEGGADLRLFADELVVHLRALLLLRTGAGTRLSDELPTDEVAWLRERAPAWSVGALMRLVQTLSESLARTRDAQQFQVQTELALLSACDVEAQGYPASPQASPAAPQADRASQLADSASRRSDSASQRPDSASQLADSASQQADRASQLADSASRRPDSASAQADRASRPPDSASPQADRASQLADSASRRPDSASAQANRASLQASPAAQRPDSASQLADSASPQADRASPRAQPAPAPLDSGAARVAAPGEQAAPVGRASAAGEGASDLPRPPAAGGGARDQPPASAVGDGARDQPSVPPLVLDSTTLTRRWPDVVDQVKSRSPLLGSALGSAHPLAIEDQVLVVAFATDFNCSSAQKPSNRQLIERAFERVYGTAFHMRCTVASATEAGPSLLDDPVINYAARTFGGQPKRLTAEAPE